MGYESGIYVLSGTYGSDAVVKVGRTSAGVFKRVAALNTAAYAGIDDWRCVCWYEENNVRLQGAFEKMAHDELHRFKISLPNGTGGEAQEVFDIHWQDAVEIINDMLASTNGSATFRPQQYGGGEAVDFLLLPTLAAVARRREIL